MSDRWYLLHGRYILGIKAFGFAPFVSRAAGKRFGLEVSADGLALLLHD